MTEVLICKKCKRVVKKYQSNKSKVCGVCCSQGGVKVQNKGAKSKGSCMSKTLIFTWEILAVEIRKIKPKARLGAIYTPEGSFDGWVIIDGNYDNRLSEQHQDDEEAWRDAAMQLGII